MRSTGALLVAALTAVLGCKGDEEVVWGQFNEEGEVLRVGVGSEDDADLGTAENCLDFDTPCVEGGCICLHSSTGRVQVGEAYVLPPFGPVGTEHQLVVLVHDDYELDVQRVTVDADAGPVRGVESFELEQDSADDGTWEVVLESLGRTTGEVRLDRFTVQLWEPLPTSAATDDEGST